MMPFSRSGAPISAGAGRVRERTAAHTKPSDIGTRGAAAPETTTPRARRHRLGSQGGIPMNDPKKMMQLVAVMQRATGEEKKNFWTKIGVAFLNKDGSWNL